MYSFRFDAQIELGSIWTRRVRRTSRRVDHLQFEFVLRDARDATLKRLHIVNPALDAAQCSKGLIVVWDV